MIQERVVPGWYKFQCRLMAFKPTKGLLFQYHRVKKRLYKLRELSQLKQQPRNLRNFETRVYSQNGEDGILAEIFRRIGKSNKVFVEFGVQDGTQCCTRYLLETDSWAGTWIECDPEHVKRAKKTFGHLPITIFERFLTADNIGSVFAEAQVPADLDLLVIDVDGNDYWMWKALAATYRPKVVVVEFNGTFGPKHEWIMPYDPQHNYDDTAYFGASLVSFAKLGTTHGYSLVGCDSMGVNAFFVRKDIADNLFDGLDRPPLTTMSRLTTTGGSAIRCCVDRPLQMIFTI